MIVVFIYLLLIKKKEEKYEHFLINANFVVYSINF